jgi:alpha-L-fucosidase 2
MRLSLRAIVGAPMTEPTRRDSLKIAALCAITASCGESVIPSKAPAMPAPAAPMPESLAPLVLWYQKPASEWIEALPVGNGRLGAMIFGGVERERIALNEDTLWAGGPYDPDNPDALTALPEIRRLIFAGQFKEAHELANARMMGKPLRQMPYQTVGDLAFAFSGLATFADYRRELDLDTAVARTSFTSGGARFTREVFASAVDQVIAIRLSSDRAGAIAFDASWATPESADATVEEGGTMVLRGRNRGAEGIPGALTFEARAAIAATGGTTSARDGAVSVRGADSAILLVAAGTSYRNYRDASGNPSLAVTRQIAGARKKKFESLLADHVAEHRRLFRRVAIDLGVTDAARRPTDERVSESAHLDDPALAALYFQYGRYLLMSCSRPGTQPANLQGLWNDSLKPPWGCKYTININTEMNYWPAESVNLGECVEPVLAMMKDLAVKGAHTAKVQYGARGWVAHHNTDLWRSSAPVDGPQWGLWPTGGAWLCMTLWEHFDYARDEAYLAEIVPILKGAAEFFLDTLVEEPTHKWLVTCPSLSPENVHAGGTSLCAGPTMDEQILRDLFSHCIEASEILKIEAPFAEKLRAARDKLAPNQVGSAGQLQEWIHDWDMQAPEMHHRHVSHLYGLYPSSQIAIDRTPDLAAAARKSLEIRGDDATGWGLAWRLNLWARLADGEHAHRILRILLGPQRTYPNLFDAHPPFQIDGNFGGVSGMVEMLMQSHGGAIRLLPALPKAWPTGSIHGLRARGGFGIDIRWKDGRLADASVRGPAGAKSVVRYGTQEVGVTMPGSGEARVMFDGASLKTT